MIERKFGMDVENLIKEKSRNHIVLKSRSFSFDKKTNPPPNITRRPSIMNQIPPSANLSKALIFVPLITDTQASDLNDVQSVPDYYQQCVKHMISKEKLRQPLLFSMQQNVIYCSKRAEIIQWMSTMHTKLKLFPQTLFISVNFMDKFASKTQISAGEEEILSLACTLMAAKFQETYRIPSIKHLLQFIDVPLTKNQIISMQEKVLHALGFDLITQISLRYLNLFAKILKMSPKNNFMAQYILELSLLETSFLEFTPSLMASSAAYLVNKIRKLSPSWPQKMVELTGHDQNSLRNCAKQLCSLLERSNELKNGSAFREKFASSQYFEASKIRLQRKNQ